MRIVTLLFVFLVVLVCGPAVAEEPVAEEPVDAHNTAILEAIASNKAEPSVRWRYIVIHHTASEWSTLARIDAYHRKKFEDPDGIEYHFLVTNGKKAPEGRIDVGRWKIQKRAIHLFKPEGAPDAIAISLVGNFHERKIGEAQFAALVELVATLAKRYEIPVENITTHTRVDGRLTVCPGKHFPYDRLVAEVSSRLATTAKPD